MRFDLTNASFRVLQRASELRFSGTVSQIFAGKLLIALFDEDESRAAAWLAEAGLTKDQFYTAFELHATEAILQSPITAPPFPMGDYGVPPSPLTNRDDDDTLVAAVQRDGRASPVGFLDSNNPPPEDENAVASKGPAYRQEPDQWVDSEQNGSLPRPKRYSLYPPFRPDSKSRSQARLYVDDQPVSLETPLAAELEETLTTLLQRLARTDGTSNRRRIPASGGGATIAELDGGFAPMSVSFATEHLLLAVVMDQGDVGDWLREHGFDPAELYERIIAVNSNSRGETIFESPIPGTAEQGIETETGPVDNIRTESMPVDDRRLARLIDASANRAREAVRVIEDFVRFMLDDIDLTRQLKEFRHELQSSLSFMPIRVRLESRNTPQDVGTEIEGRNEYRRETVHDVLAANFSRLQESLRSLEEFGKIRDGETARRFERLRYRCYTLHKVVAIAETSLPEAVGATQIPVPRPSLEQDRLYALLDVRESEAMFEETAKALISGGVSVIQLRDKNADDRMLLGRAKLLRKLTAESERRVLMIMNDRPDLAILSAADGVHVGQEEIPCENVRRIVGSEMLVGISTHNIEQARSAVLDGADYIGAGPVFDSTTKSFDATVGTEFLREVAAEIRIPAFAIGGITLENISRVLETGIHRVALSAALLGGPDIQQTAEEFSNALAAYDHSHGP